MAQYFGTNGVRGTLDTFTPELALRISQATGAYFGFGKILVARDHRLTSECLFHAVAAGLVSAGCTVLDGGVIPAPVAEFAVKKLNADGLVVITASHNPPEWNGIKVVDRNGIAISRERGTEIERRMNQPLQAGWDRVGTLQRYESAIADYIAAVLERLPMEKIRQKKLRLALDFGNGTVGLVAPALFRALGCEIVTLNSHLDGRFPGRPSEPSEANVSDLMAAVRATGSDAGVAWDGDGDRVIFVDEKGRYVIGDKVFALCTGWALQRKKGGIATTVATSRVAEEVARKYGVSVRYTRIGAPYLSEVVAQEKILLAGEEVGGVIWPELSRAKDGIFTAAKLCEALCEKPLSKWLEELPVYYNEKTKIEAKNENEKQKIIQNIRAYAVKNKLPVIDMDGVRINFPDSWVIVRASGTENYVRVFAEAKSAERAKELVEEYTKLASG